MYEKNERRGGSSLDLLVREGMYVEGWGFALHIDGIQNHRLVRHVNFFCLSIELSSVFLFSEAAWRNGEGLGLGTCIAAAVNAERWIGLV